MQRVRINTISAGQSFPKSVFLASGQKLLGAGVALTEKHLSLLRRQGGLEVYLADDAAELAAAGIGQDVHSGPNASSAPGGAGIEGEGERSGAAGPEVNGVFEAYDDVEGDARRERLTLPDAAIEQLQRELERLPLRVAVMGRADWLCEHDASGWPDPDALSLERAEMVETLRGVYARMESGVPTHADELYAVVDPLLDRLFRHPSRFTQLALLLQRNDDYLPDHSYTTAVLALSIGAHLKWSREATRTLGLAALVYDVGMLLVPYRIRIGGMELTELDRARVRKHTQLALSVLHYMEGVPPIVKLGALQHHERENGSGYLKGLRKEQICDYARVLAVADCFAAATAPRTYRKKKLPYMAMEEMLRSASAMVFWTPACRALVHSAGLFPVGSFVKLSSGSRAHVIGSNAHAVDRPVVRLLEDEGLNGQVVDLSKVPKTELAVIRPLDAESIAA